MILPIYVSELRRTKPLCLRKSIRDLEIVFDTSTAALRATLGSDTKRKAWFDFTRIRRVTSFRALDG
jgi:hypothetical protein